MERDRFSPRDLLDIQLDASADFLARWRDLASRTLTTAAVDGQPRRAASARHAGAGWTGRASPDSAAYRLTRAFRDEVTRRVIRFVLSECYEADPAFDYMTVRKREGPVWKLVNEQPLHLLDPQFASWNDLLLASLDTVIDDDDRRSRRSAARPGVVRVQRRRVPASAVGITAVRRTLAGHARSSAAGRPVHAAHALGRQRCLGAHGRVAWQRSRGHHADADRPERPSAVAVLRRRRTTRGSTARRRLSCPGPAQHTLTLTP